MITFFDKYDELCNEEPGAYQELLYCIKNGICVSGRCVEWLIDKHYELIAEEYYDDFKNSSRWSIGKAYILDIEGGCYRCWEEVGLTEMQSNEFYDQTFDRVYTKEITIAIWATETEEEPIYG